MKICRYGAGTGEEMETEAVMTTGTGAAEVVSHHAKPDYTRIRTRSELEKAVSSRGGDSISSSTIEDSSYIKVESLLDEYSQGEEEEDQITVLNPKSRDVFNDREESDGSSGSKETVSSRQSVDKVDKSANKGISVKNALGSSYKTINSARKAALSERLLNPSPVSAEKVSTSSFLEEDDRILHCKIEHDLHNRTSNSLSFDSRSKKCVTCTGTGQEWRPGSTGRF